MSRPDQSARPLARAKECAATTPLVAHSKSQSIFTRSTGTQSRSTSAVGAHAPTSDVEVSSGAGAAEKREAGGKDCNASVLAARVVQYPARRGVSHRAIYPEGT